jgi:hypothetical protein
MRKSLGAEHVGAALRCRAQPGNFSRFWRKPAQILERTRRKTGVFSDIV